MSQDEKLELDLDPKKILKALEDVSEQVKKLADDTESALGKDAVKSIDNMQKAAENGSSKITGFFRNLGQRVREDLKTAFDIAGLAGGLKMGKDLGDGIKQVFEMERAFDRLNTRLKMTSAQLKDFKVAVGRNVASTGAKLEDVLPGVETIAAKGNIKSPEQLAEISKMLGQANMDTANEDVHSLADSAVEILKNKGSAINAQSIKTTIDALQGAKVAGGFATAAEAGGATKDLSHIMSAKQSAESGLGIREYAGLAAMANKSGEGGQQVISKMLEIARDPEGKTRLNAMFGSQIFDKQGKFSAENFAKADPNKMGKYGPQVLGNALGIDPSELQKVMSGFKTGMDSFKEVTRGADENAQQFEQVSQSWAAKMDIFKANLKNAGLEVGNAVGDLASDLLKGDMKGAKKDVMRGAGSITENGGTLAAGLGLSLVGGLVAGGSANSLLSKVGLGGASHLVSQQAAKAEGVQQVFVVNAAEISGGSGLSAGGGMMGGLKSAAAFAAPVAIPAAITAAAALATAYAVDKLHDHVINADSQAAEDGQRAKNRLDFNSRNNMHLSKEEYAEAVAKGTLAALKEHHGTRPTQMTNNSKTPPTGTMK